MPRHLWRGAGVGAALAVAWLLWWGSSHLLATEGVVCADFTNAAWAGTPAASRIEGDPAAPLLGVPFARTHEQFSTHCEGSLYVDAPGNATFVLVSDDGSELFLDGQRVVDNRGRHGLTPAAGAVALLPGPHALVIRYSQEGGGSAFGLVWGLEGQSLGPLARDAVSQRPLSRTEHHLRPFARVARITAVLLGAVAIVFGLWNTPPGRLARAVGHHLIAAQAAVVSKPVRAATLLVAVAVAVRIVLSFATRGILWPDSRSYYLAALDMVRGDWLSHEIFRTPGYSWFLALFLSNGESPAGGVAVIAVQRGLGILATLILYDLGRRAWSNGVAFYAALVMAVAPLQLYYETTVASETLFVFLLLGVLWTIVRAVETLGVSWFTLAGLLCGAAVLTRPVAKGLIVVLLMAVWWHARLRPRLAAAVTAAVVAYAICVVPWMYANSRAYGFFGVARGEGLGMFMRAFDIERLPPPERTAYPEVERAHRWLSAAHPYVHYFVRDELNFKQKLNAAGTDTAMAGFAREAIAAHPAAFAAGVALDWVSLFVSPKRSVDVCRRSTGPELCSARNDGDSLPAFPASAPVGSRALRTLVAEYFDRAYALTPWLAPFALAGAILSLRRASTHDHGEFVRVLLVAVVVYFTIVTVTFNTIEDRYRLPVDGLLLLFAVGAMVRTASLCSVWLRDASRSGIARSRATTQQARVTSAVSMPFAPHS